MRSSFPDFFNIPNALSQRLAATLSLDDESSLRQQSFNHLLDWLHVPSYTGKAKAINILNSKISQAFQRINSNYIVDESKDQVLRISIPGIGERQNSKPIALLAHTDIYENKDQQDDAIKINLTEERFRGEDTRLVLKSDGKTVLGADDKSGIAAIFFAVKKLSDSKKDHPPIEIILTPDEEASGKTLIEMDFSDKSFEDVIVVDHEKAFTITDSCAGFASVEIDISGLLGAHNGLDAHHDRIDAQALSRSLQTRIEEAFGLEPGKRVINYHAKTHAPMNSLSYSGGSDNASGSAIATEARLCFTLRSHLDEDTQSISERIKSICSEFQKEIKTKDAGASSLKIDCQVAADSAWNANPSDRIFNILLDSASGLGYKATVEAMHGYTQANVLSQKKNKDGEFLKPVVIGTSIANEHCKNESLDLESVFSTGRWLENIISNYAC